MKIGQLEFPPKFQPQIPGPWSKTQVPAIQGRATIRLRPRQGDTTSLRWCPAPREWRPGMWRWLFFFFRRWRSSQSFVEGWKLGKLGIKDGETHKNHPVLAWRISFRCIQFSIARAIDVSYVASFWIFQGWFRLGLDTSRTSGPLACQRFFLAFHQRWFSTKP